MMVGEMKRCKDESGNIVPWLLRAENGALLSADEVEFNKYKRQKELIASQGAQITALGNEVLELKQLVMQLLTSNKET